MISICCVQCCAFDMTIKNVTYLLFYVWSLTSWRPWPHINDVYFVTTLTRKRLVPEIYAPSRQSACLLRISGCVSCVLCPVTCVLCPVSCVLYSNGNLITHHMIASDITGALLVDLFIFSHIYNKLFQNGRKIFEYIYIYIYIYIIYIYNI